MPKDRYPSIFSRQMEAIVFIILQILFATRAVLKIGEYPRIFSSFSWGIFGHVTRDRLHIDDKKKNVQKRKKIYNNQDVVLIPALI